MKLVRAEQEVNDAGQATLETDPAATLKGHITSIVTFLCQTVTFRLLTFIITVKGYIWPVICQICQLRRD